MWDIQKKKEEVVFVGHTDDVNDVTFSLDSKYAISASRDRTVIVWNILEKCKEIVFKGHTNSVVNVLVTHDNNYVVSCSRDRTVIVGIFRKNDKKLLLQKMIVKAYGLAIIPKLMD